MILLYDARLVWAPDTETPRQIAANVRHTLSDLSRIDPLLVGWMTSDPRDPPAEARGIDPMKVDLAPLVEAGVSHDDWGRPNAEVGGYHWWSATCEPSEPGTPHTAEFKATAGSKFRNYCEFAIGSSFEPPDLTAITYPLFEKVVLATLAIWPANWGCARCHSWGDRPAQASGDPTFPYSQYQMPWIGYLSADRTKGLAVPSELATEQTPDGGLLMIAATERLDPTKAEHMARSKLLAEIMIERGGNPAY